MLMTLIAGLSGPALAETHVETPAPTPAPTPAQPPAAPSPDTTPIGKATQRLIEGETTNAMELNAEFQAAQQAAEAAAKRATEALTPLAMKLAERAKTEAPAVIDATAEQRRASTKLLTGCLSAFKRVVSEVAK